MTGMSGGGGVLIAGIGNIFEGDDGFGVAVVEQLASRSLPPGVRVVDFGIRGLDLVYALLDGYRAAILVDATARGEMPGTLSLIEPEPEPGPVEAAGGGGGEDAVLLLSPHQMEPHKALRLAALLGGACRRIVVVACEPATLGDAGEFGEIGLSPPVAAAVPRAADMVDRLARALLEEQQQEEEEVVG